MIVVTEGIVLSRRRFGEADRLAGLFTKEFGRVSVRYVGVLKAGAKLKALSEPLVRAEFRLFLRPFSEYGKCIGGELATVHPGLRRELGRTVEALRLAELMERLAPFLQPAPEKYELLAQALAALEAEPAGAAPGWVSLAYTLRLLELSGYGAPAPAAADEALWRRLHREPFEARGAWPAEEFARLSSHAQGYLEQNLDRPLLSATFRQEHVYAHG